MNKIIYTIILLWPLTSVGKCLYLPRHTFQLSVSQCNLVTFDAGALSHKYGGYIDMQGDSVSGALLSGKVTKNQYNWEGNTIHEYFKEWQNSSFKSVFVIGDVSSICKKEVGFSIELQTLHRCCDTYPQPGFCFVPPSIPIVEAVNEK